MLSTPPYYSVAMDETPTLQQLLDKIIQQVAILSQQNDILIHQVNMLQYHTSMSLIHLSSLKPSSKTMPLNINSIPNDDPKTIPQPPNSDSPILPALKLLSNRPIVALEDSRHIVKKSEDRYFTQLSCFSQLDNLMTRNGTFKSIVLISNEDSGSTRNYLHPRSTIFLDWEIGRSATFSIVMRSRKSNYAHKLYEAMLGTYEHELFAPMRNRNGKKFFHCLNGLRECLLFIFDPGGDTINARGFFQIWSKYNVANAYFSLLVALANVLGFASGSYKGWYRILTFTITIIEAYSANCTNLTSTFLINIVLLTISTYITISLALEIPFTSSTDGTKLSSSPEEAVFWNIIGTFSYLALPIHTIHIVIALIWIERFQFIQYNIDWMDREIYGGDPSGGENCHSEVGLVSFGLMLYSIVIGLTSVGLEKMCTKWGARYVWGISNIITFVCFITMMIIIAFVASKVECSSEDLPFVASKVECSSKARSVIARMVEKWKLVNHENANEIAPDSLHKSKFISGFYHLYGSPEVAKLYDELIAGYEQILLDLMLERYEKIKFGKALFVFDPVEYSLLTAFSTLRTRSFSRRR